ncbi:MAG: CRISPR-associated endonuclease Cas3'' [Pseudomonadota bacterium]
MQPAAHIRLVDGRVETHPLDEHLREVARLARRFAAPFGGGPWAELAGLWHDLGKYRAGFQDYIRRETDPNAHIEQRIGGKDKAHSTAGAVHAIETFKRTHGAGGALAARVLAYLIASHHAGLYDWLSATGERSDLCDRLFAADGAYAVDARREYEEALAAAPGGILAARQDFDPVTAFGALPGLRDNPLGFALAVRMLFSCLVDADFLDTERFLQPERFAARTRVPTIADLAEAFEAFTAQRDAQLAAAGLAGTKVNRIRADVLAQCRSKAALQPGFFSLEVPTGGGKTLSSLAFALAHARAHGKRRVVYAIPYTSIIEQTADVFRKVFAALGGTAVIEHHSQAESDPDEESAASRLACENWDAPLVVTTNVQLFESLFAARTSRCRKLHNLVDSVIVLDEAQQLPPRFLQPVLDTLNLLATHYGATVVLCTATQPVLESTDYFDPSRNLRGLPRPVPIVDDVDRLFAELKRANVKLPRDWNKRHTLSALADELAARDCVLAIVDRKRDARELHALLPEGAIHLSGSMCGAHRAARIKEIERRLSDRRRRTDTRPLRVVSTQLVEAGVDLDFPVVYRALAGLDSIAQAAGRCNREGLLDRGEVVVFLPPQEPHSGPLRKAADAARSVLHDHPDEPLTPALFRRYFQSFYASCNPDQHGIVDLLRANSRDLAVRFRTAAKEFRFIEDDTVAVIVRYRGADGTDETVDKLIGLLGRDGPSRWLSRALQRYTVALPRARAERLALQGAIAPAVGMPGAYVQQSDLLYDNRFGIDERDDPFDPERTVI